MKTIELTIAVFLTCASVAACKKDNKSCSSTFPTKGKFVASNGSAIESKYWYRADEKLDSAVDDFPTTTKYTYPTNTIITETRDAGNRLLIKKTALFNNLGMVIRWTNTVYNTDGTENPALNSNNTYEYDGDRLIKKMTTYGDMSPATVTTYQWANGNMVLSRTDRQNTGVVSTTAYAYFDNKPFQPGDGFFMSDLISFGNAAVTIKNKNLRKSSTYNGGGFTATDIYEYTFNNNGKIITATTTEENKSVSNQVYDYTCN